MIASTVKFAQKVGCIDALIFFVTWTIIGMALATNAFEAFPFIIMMLIPASALVGWRGAASAHAILNGKASYIHAALEGFGWGATVAFVVWIWGFCNSALAAGTVFDGLSPLQSHFWLVVVTSLIPVLCIAGFCGAITGIMLHFINLQLVKLNPLVSL